MNQAPACFSLIKSGFLKGAADLKLTYTNQPIKVRSQG
jgi:hypothetical protein